MSAGRTNYKFQIKLFPRAYLAFTYKSSMCEATRNVIRRSDLESVHVCVLSHVDKWPNVAPNVATSLFNDRRHPPSLPSSFVFSWGDRYRRRSICIKSLANRQHLYASRDKNFQKFSEFTGYLCSNLARKLSENFPLQIFLFKIPDEKNYI